MDSSLISPTGGPEELPLPIRRTDLDGQCAYCNPAWLNFTGRTLEQELGNRWRTGVHPDDLGAYSTAWRSGVAKGTPFEVEYRLRRRDGVHRWIKECSAPLRDQAGNTCGYIAVCSDFTEYVSRTNIAAESSEAVRQLAENSDQVIWLRDIRTRYFFYVSPAYEKIWGRSCESLYLNPRSWREAIHPEDRQRVLEVASKEGPYSITYRIIRPDESIRWVTARVFPVRDAAGELNRTAGIVTDVTEQREIEQALQESEERLRQIAENTDHVIWLQEADNPRLLYVSSAYQKITGRTCDSLYSSPRSWREMIHLEDKKRVLKTVNQPLPNAEPLVFRIIRSDGAVRSISARAFPIRDQTGHVVRIAGIGADVTEQLQIEQALRESERRFRELAENIEQVFWMWTRDPVQLVYVSPAVERIWGRSCEDLYRSPLSWRDAIHPDDRDRAIRAVTDSPVTAKVDVEYRIVRPDGKIRWIRDRVFPVAGDDGNITRFAGVTDDITQSKQAEEALRESEQRFRQLAENIDEVFWIWTRDPMQILYVSPAYEKIWGRNREVLYESPLSWRDAVHPDDRERVIQAVTGPAKAQVDMTYRIFRPDGTLRWMRERIFPIPSDNGSIARWACVTDDISESKQAEVALQEANRRLRILSRRRVQVQEHERKFLAIELHDQMGQALTAAKLAVEAAKRTKRREVRAQQLQQATDLLNDLVQQVRRISLDLRPRVLDDLGLVPALRSLLTEQAQQSDWATDFHSDEALSPPEEEVATACFRIVLETLTNIRRHAKAKNVVVEVKGADQEFSVIIRDDGVGFDLVESGRRIHRDHLGLVGMSERASAVGGTFRCSSRPGGGTEILILLPYRAA